MSLNPLQVKADVDSGLAFVCAMCEKWWEGRDKGLGKCTGTSCAGPMSNKDFPEYSGPVSSERLGQMCFRCGCPDVKYGIKLPSSSRVLGVCAEHVKLLDDVVPVDSLEPPSFLLLGE